jgi:hypothetical protein
MKSLIFTLNVFFIASFAWAQEETKEPTPVDPNWKLKSNFGLNMTQSSFTNWAAGGRNNLSGLAFINAEANYSKDRIKWANALALALGGIQYFDEELQKTDDILDFQSTLSYGLKDPWFLSGLVGFRTQFIDGFQNVGDSLRSSTFMAPGYLNTTLGFEYVPNDHFRILGSVLSGKFTFVQDERLANQGAFGVEPAVFGNNGELITAGSRWRPEIGSYVRIIYSKEIAKNIDLRTRWEFFSNYIENPQNIDVNAELVMNFKVNSWFSASLQVNLIYDDDINITDRFGNTGPRTQFKQVIGIGLNYKLANFVEKK